MRKKTCPFLLPHLLVMLLLGLLACQSAPEGVPRIGFADAFEDDTIEKAREGFMDALAEAGFSEENGTLSVIYRNAQGDIPTLTQIIRYMITQKVDFIATNPSISTITALQNTRDIPVFMMVSPIPSLMGVSAKDEQAPGNLYGVAENLDYIDTSFVLISRLLPVEQAPLRIGLLFNQSEPQSVDAYERLLQLADSMGVTLIGRPVNATADVQLVTASLLNEDLDAFFALPDNTIFASFETILKACQEAGIPIFTSEAGLVARGAVVAYGADMYAWGKQAGEQAARFLKQENTEGLDWEMVKLRRKVYRPEAVERYGLEVPQGYQVFEE